MVSLSNHPAEARTSPPLAWRRCVPCEHPCLVIPAEAGIQSARPAHAVGNGKRGHCHAERSPRFSAQHPLGCSILSPLMREARTGVNGAEQGGYLSFPRKRKPRSLVPSHTQRGLPSRCAPTHYCSAAFAILAFVPESPWGSNVHRS